jgi:CDP-diacylglycerol--glycerol-3-phosphate 3-phosphatidyltransferase
MLITLGRLAAVPVLVGMLWSPPGVWEARAAMALFVTAMLGDIVDGWLARKWGLQSVTGAFLDPIADKLMVLSALVMMIPLGWAPAWMVLVLEARELLIAGIRQIAVSEGLVIAAGSLGKFKTAYQATAIGFLLWHYPTRFFVVDVDAGAVGLALLLVSVLFSVASAIEYGWGFVAHHRRKRAAGQAEA